MLVRVYQPVNDAVRIMRPNSRLREAQEAEAAFVARIAAVTEAADPSLKGLPFVDVDDTQLPQARTRAAGTEDTRTAWRLVNGTIAIDDSKVITRTR
jgi:hypothetical protein